MPKKVQPQWKQIEEKIEQTEKNIVILGKVLSAQKKALSNIRSKCPHNKTRTKTKEMGNDYWTTTEICLDCGESAMLPAKLKKSTGEEIPASTRNVHRWNSRLLR